MEISYKDKGKYLLKLIIVIAAVYFCVKYLLFIFLPFLIAYALKLILMPAVDFCEKKFKFNRKIFSVILLVLVSVILISVVISFIGILTKQIRKFATNSGYYVEKVEKFTDICCMTVEKYSGIESKEIKVYIEKGKDKLIENSEESGVIYKVMNKSVDVILVIINGAITMFTAVLAAYYMINKDKNKKEKKTDPQKQALLSDARAIVKKVTKVCTAYLRTQMIIMLVTFTVCLMAFLIIGNSYAFLLAVIVGLLDSLPLIGVGTMLIPYALINLLLGEYMKAIVVFAAFGICYMFREVMEPRLMGSKVGISPLATIVSIYTGLKIFGIIGVLLGPVVYIIIFEIMEMTKT